MFTKNIEDTYLLNPFCVKYISLPSTISKFASPTCIKVLLENKGCSFGGSSDFKSSSFFSKSVCSNSFI